MQSRRHDFGVVILAAVTVWLAGCSGDDSPSMHTEPAATPQNRSPTVEVEAGIAEPVETQGRHGHTTEPKHCTETIDSTLDLLRSGLGDAGYEPAADLQDLVATADLVLTGTIESIERPRRSAGTSISVSGTTVVAASHTPSEPVTQIWLDSHWGTRARPDPLASPAPGHGARFIAFLHRFDGAPGGFAVGVQGLSIDCNEPAGEALAVVAALPPDGQGRSVQQLVPTLSADAQE